MVIKLIAYQVLVNINEIDVGGDRFVVEEDLMVDLKYVSK